MKTINKLGFRVVPQTRKIIRRCSNLNCEKRSSCFWSVIHMKDRAKVNDPFFHNETTCKEYIKREEM